MKINVTTFRVLLGAGQVQYQGRREGGMEEGRKEGPSFRAFAFAVPSTRNVLPPHNLHG